MNWLPMLTVWTLSLFDDPPVVVYIVVAVAVVVVVAVVFVECITKMPLMRDVPVALRTGESSANLNMCQQELAW